MRRLAGRGFAMGILGALLLVAACADRPSATAGPPPPPAPLAETAANCFGFTVRLTLVRAAGDADPATPRAVRGVRWRLDVTGRPGEVAAEESLASLDIFTIRGERAARDDLAIVRLSGATTSLSAEGPLRLPEVGGAIRDGDGGRIFASLRTPRGQFGVRGIIFTLHPGPDGLGARGIAVLPPEGGCPVA